jgi:bifunctional non-homologous end joining protein LigD
MNVIVPKGSRSINRTPEYPPLQKGISQKRIFVVHRHLGSILHYDLRIEINGILKCWAIPKGPSMNVGDRRLSILVDNQPLSYASFKGTEPDKNYKSGTVEIWDKGFYTGHSTKSSICNNRDLLCQLKEGRLKFTLKGKKLKGVFSLVRINGVDSQYWVLIKGNDKFAVTDPYDSEHYIGRNSTINKILRELGGHPRLPV